MKKKVCLAQHNENWKIDFNYEYKNLKNILGRNFQEAYHVGSTSIPGIYAKPTIDIICVVKNLENAITPLKGNGYTFKGELNLPMRLFFSRKKPVDINLHICKRNSPEIKLQLCFRDFLIANPNKAQEYSKLKLDLVKQNEQGFEIINNSIFNQYTLLKDEFIKKILNECNFDEYRLVKVLHFEEENAYKNLLKLKEINYQNDNIANLILYRGIKICGAATIFINKETLEFEILKQKFLYDSCLIVFSEKLKEWQHFVLNNKEKPIFT